VLRSVEANALDHVLGALMELIAAEKFIAFAGEAEGKPKVLD
jgi:hypothetical protein